MHVHVLSELELSLPFLTQPEYLWVLVRFSYIMDKGSLHAPDYCTRHITGMEETENGEIEAEV